MKLFLKGERCFKESCAFEKRGWECDSFKIRKKAEDILNPPFNPDDYDFLCAGSGICTTGAGSS